MNREVFEKLKEAAKTGEIVRIIYNGGNQPGAVREVSPIVVTEREMNARDVATSVVKTFILSKIQFPESTTNNLKQYDPNAPPFPKTELQQTIKEALVSKVSELESLGWKVVIDTNIISVHRYFKNGTPHKIPDICFSYYEFVIESYYDPDKNDLIDEKQKSTRPYRIDSPSFAAARTFTNLSNAIELFLNEVRLHAPNNTH